MLRFHKRFKFSCGDLIMDENVAINNNNIEVLIMSQKWWTLALQGLAALLFGIMTLSWPGLTLEVLIIFFGAFALIDGLFALVAVFTHDGQGHRGMLILQGVSGVIVGIIAFAYPGVTMEVLLLLIIAWTLITGVFKITGAFQQSAGAEGKWLLALSGFLSVAIAVMLFSLPEIVALVVISWLIAFYAIIAGITLLALGFMLRGKQTKTPSFSTA